MNSIATKFRASSISLLFVLHPSFVIAFLVFNIAHVWGDSLGTAFTYQGRLTDNGASAIGDGEMMANSIGMKMKQIPAGTFTMGSEYEKPVHQAISTPRRI